MYIDKRFLYVALAIIVIMNLSGYISNPAALLGLVLSVPGVLIAITFHEYAHALAADKIGDDTARRQGRLTLNPLKHMDPFGILMLLFAGFGWGKPVEVNPNNFNRKITVAAGNAIVSLAGPLMNFILAIIFTIIYYIILKFAPAFFISNQIGVILSLVIVSIIQMNIGLGVFNLIPLPPLDGSKVLNYFLPTNARKWMEEHQNIFYIIFLVLWVTGLAGTIISPVISWVSKGIFSGIGHLFNII